MKPWVGEKYRSPQHKRLLVVGESHYLPQKSKIHLDAVNWYERKQVELTETEIKWISTSGIIKNNKEKNFPKKAHGIYKNACVVINECSFKYDISSKAIDHYAYYNFFQRPADVTGDSIKVQKIDRDVSETVFLSILGKLDPELIIFTSSLAGKAASKLVGESGIPYVVTPHPTSAWWNRFAKKYNGRGKDLVPAFLSEYGWLA